jgi:uncharacterized protein YbjT (DUF2867 family)
VTAGCCDTSHLPWDVTGRASGLAWTIVRPPRLTDGPGAGRYRRADGRDVPGGFSIARRDLAAALLDLADDRAAIGHVISVAG